jgi:hypothetical protein
MTDKEVEKEIIEKGLTAPRVTIDNVNTEIVEEMYHLFPGTTTMVCALRLKNGFVVVGDPSASASPENYDEELGKKISKHNAVHKAWSFMGFRLRDKLYSLNTDPRELANEDH